MRRNALTHVALASSVFAAAFLAAGCDSRERQVTVIRQQPQRQVIVERPQREVIVVRDRDRYERDDERRYEERRHNRYRDRD